MIIDPWLPLTQSLVLQGVLHPSVHVNYSCILNEQVTPTSPYIDPSSNSGDSTDLTELNDYKLKRLSEILEGSDNGDNDGSNDTQ